MSNIPCSRRDRGAPPIQDQEQVVLFVPQTVTVNCLYKDANLVAKVQTPRHASNIPPSYRMEEAIFSFSV